MTREHSRHAGRGPGTGASAGATGGSLAQPPRTAPPSAAEPPLADRLLAALRDTRYRTLFATELAAVARAAGCAGDRFERLLAGLEHEGRVLVLGRPPPDVHLAGTDLRTVHACDHPAPDAAEPGMTDPGASELDRVGPDRVGPDPTELDRAELDPTELARRRGEAHWAEFLRTFLATRRCC